MYCYKQRIMFDIFGTSVGLLTISELSQNCIAMNTWVPKTSPNIVANKDNLGDSNLEK